MKMQKSFQKEESPINKRKFNIDVFMIIILSILIFDLQLFGGFGETFFRDFSVIFEGGYRIGLHQVPYHDFYIPLGPIIFYIQAFFNLLFGTNLLAMLIHSFTLAIVLSIIFYYIARKKLNPLLGFIFALFFYLSFNGLEFFPFYTSEAYFFFFLNMLLLLRYYDKPFIPKYLYLLSALLVTLAFYCKQDIGLLQLFFVLLYLIFSYRKQFKTIIFIYLIPALILMIGFYIIFSNLGNFQYWFNLGQSPHESRIANILSPKSIWGLATSWKLYIALFVFVCLIWNKKKNKPEFIKSLIKDDNSTRLLYIFLIISFTTLITQSTSGLVNNSFVNGIPILIFILYIIIDGNTNALKKVPPRVIYYFMIIVLLLAVNPFTVYGQILLNYKNPELVRIDEGCYTGSLLPKTAFEGLSTIRKTIETNNYDFISLTEYTFLYCDYNIKPPSKLPLWFDEEISFFDENIPNIINTIKSKNPKVILLQDPHRHENRTLNEYFEKQFLLAGYTETNIVDAAASYGKTFYSLGYTKTEVIKIAASTAPITILVRNDSFQTRVYDNPQIY